MQTKTSITICVGLLLAAVMPGVVQADNAPCSSNTTRDRVDCSGSCAANYKIGIQMYSNDANSEYGFANTSCSNATAACEFVSPDGACGAESEVASASAGPWACHFEAHDEDWWGWDHGFSYNCYSYYVAPPTPPGNGKVIVGTTTPNMGGTSASAGSIGCSAIPSGAIAENPLLATLCAKLTDPEQADRLVVKGASVQMVVYAAGGSAAGIACDAGSDCWLIQPVCVASLGTFACDVTPVRVL